MRLPLKAQRSLRRAYSCSRSHLRVRNATIASRPVKNSSRLRHCESSVYAAATRSGSRVFQASSAAWTFWRAVSSVKGGTGGLIGVTLRRGRADFNVLLLGGRPAPLPRCAAGEAARSCTAWLRGPSGEGGIRTLGRG